MDVDMRHVKASNNQSYPWWVKHFFETVSNPIHYSHNFLISYFVEIFEISDLFFRYNKHVSRIYRMNIQEGKGVLIFIYFMGGNFSLYNLGKNTICHTMPL